MRSAAKDRNSYKAGGAAAQRAGAAQHPGLAQQEMVRVWSLVALEAVASLPIISGITHIADTHGRFAQQEHDAVLAPGSLNTPGNPAATNGSHQLPPSIGADRPGGHAPQQGTPGVAQAECGVKRLVIPDALRVLRLQHGHKFCKLGDLSASVGWRHQATVAELEAKRKAKAAAYYEAKKKQTALRAKAEASVPAQ